MSPVSVLLVDDQPEGLLALEATLAPLGLQLVTARSGREALRHLLSQDFAAILLDVVMPGMDGFETASLIRERERSRHTPLLFLTALSRGQLPELRAYAVGAVDYLLKPYEPEILRSKVSVFADLYRKTELVKRQAEVLRQTERREHENELAEAQRRVDAERARAREELLRREMETHRNQQRWLEAVLAALPTPLALVEPGTGHTLLANRAAQGLAGGGLAYREAQGLHEGLVVRGPQGQVLSTDEQPLMRAARGEALQGFHVDWEWGGQQGSVRAFSTWLPRMHGRPETVLLALLDVAAPSATVQLVEGLRQLAPAHPGREDMEGPLPVRQGERARDTSAPEPEHPVARKG
ncbi:MULTISPECIES: two-component system response regulator [unclassified Myxococcus]|uniref:response regulator n=1 Tax=unclassified Myxococcus TaxID=2648731 RepID=UPI001D6F5F8E|nr:MULTISPECIES: response regulator [unclassified Myxococcus]MBZ4395742.1 response regulator [Myxococcus sp. AS-1-15]MBZ4411358.1 response regulator [Myxococcus sp. XM-1-1-1]BDT31102.1 response regulator [Myxococcus sp. MH1]